MAIGVPCFLFQCLDPPPSVRVAWACNLSALSQGGGLHRKLRCTGLGLRLQLEVELRVGA
jgi:hypothetical protein